MLKKLLIFISLLSFSITLFAAPVGEQLAEILGNLKSLQANFMQTIYDSKGNTLQESSGLMMLQRPGKFRWEVQKPSQQLLIADGKHVWFYDIGLMQVSVQKQQTTRANSPAMLLSGSTESLIQNFIITKQIAPDTNSLSFKLVPKNNSNIFQAVQLDFRSSELDRMKLTDNLGQTTVVKFSQVKTNPTLSTSLFKFTPPKGVDVVTN